MSFKDIPIDISYKSVGEDPFSEIINPLLSCAKTYKRSVGFFSSSALSFIGDGIIKMVRNGGHIYLATSPKLSEEDIETIKAGYESRELIKTRFISEVKNSLLGIDDSSAELLFMLVKENCLDIKIVLINSGMYHDKLAVLDDFDGNTIVCVGSNNESGSGYGSNYEKTRVYKSWLDQEGRVVDETEEFNNIWSNNNNCLKVLDFMEAFEAQLLERIEHTGYYKREAKSFVPRPYQDDAKLNWIKNGYKGFFVMATGTGKTLTSLYSIQELIRENQILTIIAVPYKHLVNQWYEDACSMFPDVSIFMVHGEIKNAEERIYASYISSKTNYKPIIVITTIKSFFIEKYENIYKRIPYKKLLIVDEAHNFFNCISDELSEMYCYKLGLSATPVFGTDASKTKTLLDWFGGMVMDFPIEKAIGKYLVNYEYHPIYVNATDSDEVKFNRATQVMLSAIDPNRHIIVDEERFVLGYRGRLRAISMAEEKTSKIEIIFSQVKDKDHTIIYCSDGRMFFDNRKENITEEVRHLEYILRLINLSIIDDENLQASKFTATEDVETRMQLIDYFNKGYINYLVAIKCLDEGINIPSIKSALILSSNDNYREFVQRRGRILRKYSCDSYKKEKADIYDVIVLPNAGNKSFATIELRRFYEYSRLALNKEQLFCELEQLLSDYDLTVDNIKFDNEYAYGGELDE